MRQQYTINSVLLGASKKLRIGRHKNFNELMPAYEKFIEDNLKLINIWNTGVRWVIDILDNPCVNFGADGGWSEDVEWKDELNAVLPFSFINYWKKVGSLCEGENKGYPKVTEEIKTIINKDTGAKSANFLFDKWLRVNTPNQREEESEKPRSSFFDHLEPNTYLGLGGNKKSRKTRIIKRRRKTRRKRKKSKKKTRKYKHARKKRRKTRRR
jgi:hypothetical protein